MSTHSNKQTCVRILRELYSGYTSEIIEAYKAGELSDLEKLLNSDEIEHYEKYGNTVMYNLVYHQNPFLKLVK